MSQAPSPRPSRLAVVLLALCLPAVAAAQSAPAPAAASAKATPLFDAPDHPRMHVAGVRDALHPSVLRALTQAYALAVRKVRTVPSCRALFERLGADPVQMLMNSRYKAASPEHENPNGPCQRGAAAVTAVGSPEVRLCVNFGALPTAGATLILLHEALHYAGLGEWPSDPGAMTRNQINLMIRDSCGL